MPFDATPTTTINVEAFRHLKRVLRVVEEKSLRFNLYKFYEETPCGTVACALGWASQDERFMRAIRVIDNSTWAKGLGISDTEHGRLFYGRPGYSTPADVIAEIDALLARHGVKE